VISKTYAFHRASPRLGAVDIIQSMRGHSENGASSISLEAHIIEAIN
jgi:hypothetical protein